MNLAPFPAGDEPRANSLFQRLSASRMARQAAYLMGLNTLAKGVAFLGSAYAAKCLGPVNLGISALVLSVSQFVGVFAAGGLDSVAVRRISANPACTRDITMTVVRFRAKVLAVLLPLGLAAALLLTRGAHPLAWTAGALIPVATCLGLMFVFQGLEKLPVQALVGVLTSMLAAGAYFLFRPGMPAGSDLSVMAGSGLLGAAVSFYVFRRLTRGPLSGENAPPIRELLMESRPYWMLALAIYFYSSFQIPLVGYFESKRMVGAYRSALMLAAGLDLFYGSVNSLLLPRLVVWKQKGIAHLWLRQKELLALFAAAGAITSVAVIMLAPLIYRRFLGPEFMDAVLPFQILVAGRFVVFLGQIFAWSLVALHLDRQFFLATIAGAVFSVCANIIVIPTYGISGAATVSLLSEAIIAVSCFVVVRRRVAS